MDLRLVCVVACLCALALVSAEAGIPKCCVKTRPISYLQLKRLLRGLDRIVKQESTGACDIEAVQLYLKGRKSPICANPKVLDWLEEHLIKMRKQLDKLKA